MKSKLSLEDRQLLREVEVGDWKPVAITAAQRKSYAQAARNTLRKDQRINIRLSTADLRAIQKRAQDEGLPYQTLIASLLHKYASGRLREA
jgi:predicted DNA binding CopG/RHH family protein